MTVGIIAACQTDTDDPQVVIAADRMLTAQRQSPIEYEHPGTKLSEIAATAPNVHLYSVYSGGVGLAREFHDSLRQTINHVRNENPDVGVRTIAQLAESQYSQLVRERVQSKALDPLGLDLDDLSKQHQFKDDFLQSIWGDVEEERQYINQNLTVLLGGVDGAGAHIYGISDSTLQNLNSKGYASTGSGYQPAQSEFIRCQYHAEDDLKTALSVTMAAKTRAEQAQGVGEETDIAIAHQNDTALLTQTQVDFLRDREEKIRTAQAREKTKILEAETREWEEP